MQFGVTLSSDDPRDIDPRRRAADHLERAVRARDAGFDTLSVAHRYSIGPARLDERGTPRSTWRFQAWTLLAHVSGYIGDAMGYATQVLVSPGLHPVQLAEDIATLDALTGGRLRVGIGLGWMPSEFEAFGVPMARRGERMEELVTLVRRLLTEEAVTFEGRHFSVRDVSMTARTVQQPMPPLWLGASALPGIKRAARLGDTWAMSGHTPLDELAAQQREYFAELDSLGRPRPSERPLARLVYVARDRETAIREATPAITEWYRKKGEWGWQLTKGSTDRSLREIAQSGRWIIGDAEDCIEQICRCRDELGVNHIIFGMPWPDASQEKRLRTIDLLGEQVLPAFRRPAAT